jgi:hypothetical protein
MTWDIPTAVSYIDAVTLLLIKPVIAAYSVLIAIKLIFLMINTI